MARILITSGTAFRNDSNIGKTLISFFAEYDKDELSNIYFHNELPNVDYCKNVYRITEKDIVKNLFGTIGNCGGEISNISCEARPISRLSSHREATSVMICREILWLLAKLNTKVLFAWLDKVSPKVIFSVMPGSAARARFIARIAEKYDVPVILFITDDYYNDFKLSSNIFRKIHYKFLQNNIDRLCLNHVRLILGCSELAAHEFGSKYRIDYDTIFTPYNPKVIEFTSRNNALGNTVIFRYFGNLGLERWKTLVLLGNAIDKLNKANGARLAFLEVYGPQVSEEIIEQINESGGGEYKGFVLGDEYWKLLADTDVAVHVESFSPEMCRRTRLSISTKITDYMGAGKCIMAIGSSELASIQHLRNCAVVVDNINKIYDGVVLCQSRELIKDMQIKASKAAQLYHNPSTIPVQLKKAIESIMNTGLIEINE